MYNYEYDRDKNNRFVIAYEESLCSEKHFHNCFEIIYVIDGEAVAHIDDIEYRLSSKQLCIVSGFSAHYYETIQSGKYIVCLIPPRYFREHIQVFNENSFKNPIISDIEIKPILNILQQAKSINQNLDIFGCPSENITEKYKEEQLHHLSAYLINFFITQCGMYKRNRISSLVADAVNIIENNFKNDISLNFICKKLGCSQKNLSTNFKKTMNMSILNYIVRARVLEAARLLQQFPQMTNEAVMLEAGFQSSRSFLRHLRNVFNCTPNEYKNSIKNNTR